MVRSSLIPGFVASSAELIIAGIDGGSDTTDDDVFCWSWSRRLSNRVIHGPGEVAKGGRL